MFTSLKSTLDGCGVSLESGPFHYIMETPFVSANPLINYYLLNNVNERKICFLALQNTWSHYCNIGNKFGINLKNKCDDGAITVLDGLKLLTTLIAEENIKSDNPLSFVINKKQHSLENLFMYIQNAVQKFRNNSDQFVIIIDSVMPLLHLGADIEEIESFIRYCCTLTSNTDLVVLSLCIDKNDSKAYQLAIMLSHTCSVLLSVKELSTGTSKDIHGELNIHVTPKESQKLVKHHHQYHYKIEERDVKVFAPGLALSIL